MEQINLNLDGQQEALKKVLHRYSKQVSPRCLSQLMAMEQTLSKLQSLRASIQANPDDELASDHAADQLISILGLARS